MIISATEAKNLTKEAQAKIAETAANLAETDILPSLDAAIKEASAVGDNKLTLSIEVETPYSREVKNQVFAFLRQAGYYVSLLEFCDYFTFWRAIPMTTIRFEVSW